MKRLTLLILGILLLLAGPGWAADWYASGGCAGTHVGTSANPFATIAQINAAAITTGDTVWFKRGTTFAPEVLIPQADGITYNAYDTGAPPVLGDLGKAEAMTNNGRDGIVVNNLKLGSFLLSGTANATLNYCILGDTFNAGLNYIISNTAAGTLTLNNCLVYKSKTTAYYEMAVNNASAVIKLRNTVVCGSFLGLRILAGSYDIDYSLLAGNTEYGAETYGAGYTLGSNVYLAQEPGFTSYRISNDDCYFMLGVDDTSNLAYVQALVAALPATVKISWFINSSTVTDLPAMQALPANVRICNHSAIHNNYGATYAFKIRSANAVPTVAVDATAGNVILKENGSAVLTYSMADHTITNLKAAIPAGWTITDNGTNPILGGSSLRILNDTAGDQACVSDYSMPLNKAATGGIIPYGFYQDILDCQTYITNNFGFTPTTFAFPNGITDATILTWVRTVANFTGSRLYVAPPDTTSSIPIFQTHVIPASYLDDYGTDEAGMRKMARQLYINARQLGKATMVFSHNSTELPVASMGYLVDELNNLGVNWYTYDEFITAIRASYTPNGDNTVWTKTLTDSFNPLPTDASVLRNHGTAIVGLQNTDILGNPIKGVRDIGPYENQTAEGGGGLSLGMGLGGGNYRPRTEQNPR